MISTARRVHRSYRILSVLALIAFAAAPGCAADTAASVSADGDITQSTANLKNLKIEAAFQSDSGKVLIEFASAQGLPPGISGNAYWGDSTSIARVERLGSRPSDNGGREASFEDGEGHLSAFVDASETRMILKSGIPVTASDAPNAKTLATLKRLSTPDTERMLASIKSKKTTLKALIYRKVENVFKFENSESYVVIDDAKPSVDYTGFRAFIGAPGRLKQETITNVERTRLGGDVIRLANGTTLYGGPEPTIGERKLVRIERPDTALLKTLGLDPKAYEKPAAPTLSADIDPSI